VVIRPALAFLTVASFIVLAAGVRAVQIAPGASYPLKSAAVKTAVQAQAAIGDRIIGPEFTEITTTLGPLAAKRLSRHPDFAAAAVQLLLDAGVRRGDRVAVNFSGSFPALNIAVLSALSAIGAEPVITSSVGASTWGATDPGFTWLDMEDLLVRQGLWPWRSAAAFLGGAADRGGGMAPGGAALAAAAIARSGVPAMNPGSLEEAVALRLAVYRGGGKLPAALVNVGGSHVIFGREGHRTPLRETLTAGYKPYYTVPDGLAAPFVHTNRPVIHFINISHLAAVYGIREGNPPGTSEVMYEKTIPPAVRLLCAGWLVLAGWALWRIWRAKGGRQEP